ncbi:MAG: hypothetical protein AAB658_09855, partial [Chloroflexota bacterium]
AHAVRSAGGEKPDILNLSPMTAFQYNPQAEWDRASRLRSTPFICPAQGGTPLSDFASPISVV